ncbi:MAG: hypothetical protein KQJ78_12210 [Deltaproteobacteria bacterium]|nr:hypothetical protein [Deltaproteobacteria bacterium]
MPSRSGPPRRGLSRKASVRTALEEYGRRVGFGPAELSLFPSGDPRVRHIKQLSQTGPNWTIVAEVISARHCHAGFQPGDRIILDADGNLLAKHCPPRLCIYAMAQLVLPVALINERLSEGLEPNGFHFMHEVACPDLGPGCRGYGQMRMRVRAELRVPRPAASPPA